MKAAVMDQHGGAPRYADFPSPVVTGEEEAIITVKAAAIKHIDRGRASGTHYSSDDERARQVIGGDGVGLLSDGTRVYAINGSGMVAEQAETTGHYHELTAFL